MEAYKGENTMKNTGKQLESYVQYVYARLLELNDYDDVIVSTNVTIKGKSGATNEFDVFYQFAHLNMECKVVMECKDWQDPVSVKEVRDFVAKIEDVGMGQFVGVMVSKNGYQDGAEKFAQANGIKLLKESDLPTIPQLLAGIIQKAFLPTEKCIGEPFWTIMEYDNGNVTGTYMSIQDEKGDVPIIPLCFSYKIAELVLSKYEDADCYCIRGVTQYQLRGLLALEEFGHPHFAIFFQPMILKGENELPCVFLTANEVAENYLRK